MASCVPTLRPLYLILFRRPGAEHYGGSSRQKRSYQRHTSPDAKFRKNKGPDTELMSSDTGWNATTLRGTDGDGEGLVKPGEATIRQTVEMDVRYDSESGSAEQIGEGRQGQARQRGW